MVGYATSAVCTIQPAASGGSIDAKKIRRSSIHLEGFNLLTCFAACFIPSSLICTTSVTFRRLECRHCCGRELERKRVNIYLISEFGSLNNRVQAAIEIEIVLC